MVDGPFALTRRLDLKHLHLNIGTVPELRYGGAGVRSAKPGSMKKYSVWADIVTGAATVILAMGAGKKAAASMKKALLDE